MTDYKQAVEAAFPDDLKPRTLIMLSRNSPFYTSQLTPSELARDDKAFGDAISLWRQAGCESAEYGRGYDKLDFGDRTHLTAAGGVKLAATVADLVRSMSVRLGYSPKEAPQP